MSHIEKSKNGADYQVNLFFDENFPDEHEEKTQSEKLEMILVDADLLKKFRAHLEKLHGKKVEI